MSADKRQDSLVGLRKLQRATAILDSRMRCKTSSSSHVLFLASDEQTYDMKHDAANIAANYDRMERLRENQLQETKGIVCLIEN